ncbi:thiamine biosynthesis lipoprotein [Anaerocolumna jejuensis DSM 15929]|uniref:FAD:protein FMN transferase n=1 Tax=Anaerocolumna jejuensis DSM 15929 TaxID=1121322 RepID=A0A1M7AY22_9FIRM|nr:FAD:protein FMN transferase [Anaerocolumna jejuensis]SHL47611.1 thiamine biosynthesis lipoprotein [Anaerocolumna jejuensis DSM 15929]
MGKRLIAMVLVLINVISLTSCGITKTKRYEAEFLVLFDTVTKIVGYADSKEEFDKNAHMIYDELKIYHELYDIYNDYDGINNIKTINENAGIKPVKVDKKLIDMLLYAKEAYKETDGKLNIALGAVLQVWHQYREEGINNPDNAKVPPMKLLKEKNKHTDINNLIINEKDSTVFLKDPEMSLDVGGVGKGYATEQVCQYAQAHGFVNGMVSVGGNVRVIGSRDGKGEPWHVGIQNPDLTSEKTNLKILNLTDASLVSSGDYERYYMVDGVKYHHIIDPVTLMPSTYFTAVTIVCKDSGMADAYTKAIYNMPYEDGLQFVEKHPEIEALWVFKNGDLKYSPGFEKYIRE